MLNARGLEHRPAVPTMGAARGIENVFIEDENNQVWYILHPINKEVILVGNESEPTLCIETIIMKLEDLYKVPIKIEKSPRRNACGH